MATSQSNIYAKVNCYSDYRRENYVTSKHFLAGDFYTSLFKFLQDMTSSGVTQLVTLYTGSGGNGIGYWNEPTRFGAGAFSVWKFAASGERTWDWYFYIHTNSGSAAASYEETQNQVPSKMFGGATSDGANVRSVGMQAAICLTTSLSGSLPTNPWNGTINLSGAAYKTSPVWNTGSNPNNKLFVFPRQNYLSGSAATNKENMMPLVRTWDGINECALRWNFFCDGHGLLIVRDLLLTTREPKRVSAHYIGPYRLTSNITKSNPGNVMSGTGSLGFIMFNSCDWVNTPTANTIPENTVIGQTGYVTASFDGGALASLNQGVRTFLLSLDQNSIQNINSCFTNILDERQLYVYMSGESGFNGFTGNIETPLIRIAKGISTHDFSGSRAGWNGNTTTDTRSILTPWPTSSIPPGKSPIGLTRNRDGYSYIINNYSI